MIITCPNCATKFAVPETALGTEGRKLKCAKCNHVWFQTPLAADGPDADLETVSPAEAGQAARAGSPSPVPPVSPEPVASPSRVDPFADAPLGDSAPAEADVASAGGAPAFVTDDADHPSFEVSPPAPDGPVMAADTPPVSFASDGAGSAKSGSGDPFEAFGHTEPGDASLSGGPAEARPAFSEDPDAGPGGFADAPAGPAFAGDDAGDDAYDPFRNDPLLSSSPVPEPDVPGPVPVADPFASEDPEALSHEDPAAGPDGGFPGDVEETPARGGDDYFAKLDALLEVSGDPVSGPDQGGDAFEDEPAGTPLDQALDHLGQALDQAEGTSAPLTLASRAGRESGQAGGSAPGDDGSGSSGRAEGLRRGGSPADGGVPDARLPKVGTGPVPSRSVKGRRVLEVLAVVLIVVNVVCLAFLLLRDPISRFLPETTRIYSSLAVPLNAVDDQIIFQNVVEEHSDPGVQPRSLTVRGILHNPSETTPLPVNGVLLQVFDSKGTMLQSVRGAVAKKVLQPGESVPFEITMLNLHELATGYNLTLAPAR